ncbi:hypothetical protein KC573_02390 [candidate division WWE3 bacterium]|uniref:DUF948 domain-containing protein n=1 Tax=candidate division WWE3 bacterium TaxID=2053526 RepID=A0A955LW81_UNCKA|nr:hypothetical protein [candidate division WWE3 bacterium]
MLDTTQILLLILTVLLGGTLILIGIQLYFILRELRKGMQNVNSLLEEFQSAAGNLTSSTQHIKDSMREVHDMTVKVKEGISTPLVSGLASFGLVRSLLQPLLGKDEEDEEE